MAGYWGKMERIVCSYQPLPGSQIAWWGRIIKNEQSENKTRATWERARWRREKKADLATGRERQLTTGKRAERKLPVLNLPLCHWSSQSFLWTKTWICFKFAQRKYDANLCKLGTTFAQIYSPVCKNLNIVALSNFEANPFFRPVFDLRAPSKTDVPVLLLNQPTVSPQPARVFRISFY